MNYRHAFHAGNFADVHKHVALLLLLRHLHKKPTPFFVLDTHAGRGAYDLASDEALRGNEWEGGIGRLLRATPQPAPDPTLPGQAVLDQYRGFMDSTAKSYAGSPLIVATMLREKDRAVFVERHPEEAAALRRALGKRKRVAVVEDDGYAAMKAQLPPNENRGLVLIDPPYESDSEFADATRALQTAYGRWSNGVYCLWYPIKPGAAHEGLLQSLRQSGIKKILVSTLNVRPSDSPLGLNGSGLVFVNPPWQADTELRLLLAELHPILSPDRMGGFNVAWLVGE